MFLCVSFSVKLYFSCSFLNKKIKRLSLLSFPSIILFIPTGDKNTARERERETGRGRDRGTAKKPETVYLAGVLIRGKRGKNPSWSGIFRRSEESKHTLALFYVLLGRRHHRRKCRKVREGLIDFRLMTLLFFFTPPDDYPFKGRLEGD